MTCGCYGQPLSWAELLFGRLKNEARTRTKRADANEDGDLPDRDGRTRDIRLLPDPGEAQPTLNSIKNYGEGF